MPVSGTTRDSIYTRFKKFDFDFLLVDTAGLRKKSKVNEDLEFYSVIRSIRAIENADVCLLLIDATQGIEAQDMNIFHLVIKNHKGVVVLVNKWDLVEKTSKSAQEFETRLRDQLRTIDYLPIIFVSAKNKQRIFKVLDIIISIYDERNKIIRTRKLNSFLDEVTKRHTI